MSDRKQLERAWDDFDLIHDLAIDVETALHDGDTSVAFDRLRDIREVCSEWEDPE